MDSQGHVPKPRKETVIVYSQLTGIGLSLMADESITADDQPHLSPGELDHHICELMGDGAILICYSLPGCGTDKTVG
jgi:hypothetical protein